MGEERIRLILQLVSAVAAGLAVLSVVVVIALRIIHWFTPAFDRWSLRSGIPLILIGLSFACLQSSVRRTHGQRALGLAISFAFILWGVEQFLTNREIISFIDDLVVFLFVLDLSIVIHGALKGKMEK